MNELWTLLKYLFLGVFQGFTEPIPISSSGHLMIVRHLMEIDDVGIAFEGFVNFGSLVAVLIIYRKDLYRLTVNSLQYIFHRDQNGQSDFKFVFFLIIATVPAGVIGVLFDDAIESFFSEDIQMIGTTLIITGIALWIIRNLRGRKQDGDLTVKDAVIVGLAQAVALMPGISRSGATIVAAMLLGMKQETALRFSFLLYIPVSIGTMIFSVTDLMDDQQFDALLIPYIFAFAGSIVASYYALLWFMNIMRRGNLKYFAFYCFAAGGLILLFL
ncbi:MAG: undecaprenyl-diphosphate phosphatase [Bacillaceae bacterium]|nr:undecaprenyl-diphosphate phosphatase [Bacillaceae bacterium]